MEGIKLLILDRDGTLIVEPPDNQIDSLEKWEMIPGVIRNLYRIQREFPYKFIMVTNQDGLGTSSFPEEDFWPAQKKLRQLLAGEGIEFSDILIDRSREEERKDTRKPRTGLMKNYLEGSYDLSASIVIGDRITDVEFAQNLGCRAIWFNDSEIDTLPPALRQHCLATASDWDEIYEIIRTENGRRSDVKRTTRETDIEVRINLDGAGLADINTGLGFFDHMLEQLSKHGEIDLFIEARGDLHIDAHHTIEDTAIVLGQAFAKALKSMKGVERYGFCLPMDESEARVTIDISGRPWLVWNVDFKREKIGEMPTEMFFHFFKSFSDHAKWAIHIQADGENEHHKIEAIFKAFARTIRQAKRRTPGSDTFPSTKGLI
jgi:imidazoleglycerol-phosphate dehydratase/histidinol-phosphatase